MEQSKRGLFLVASVHLRKELRRREEAQAASKAEEAQRAAKTTQRDSRGQPQRTPSFGEVPKFGKEGRAHSKSLPDAPQSQLVQEVQASTFC